MGVEQDKLDTLILNAVANRRQIVIVGNEEAIANEERWNRYENELHRIEKRGLPAVLTKKEIARAIRPHVTTPAKISNSVARLIQRKQIMEYDRDKYGAQYTTQAECDMATSIHNRIKNDELLKKHGTVQAMRDNFDRLKIRTATLLDQTVLPHEAEPREIARLVRVLKRAIGELR